MQKINKLHILLLLCFISLLLGCGHEDNKCLAQADRMMSEHSDSALDVLESVDLSTIKSKSDRALYGLLMTQALDKNHLNPVCDSMITSSVDYYNQSNDIDRRIMASYYQGRVYFNKNNQPMALVSFFKAKNMADSTGDFFWAAMACRGISDIYITSPTMQPKN